ncbi:crossover junction endodeoxyribonuclease RuvC [Paenibacillus alvei]|uniref:crossover junction endodeoxyribonuclease RuvC n=1 Tax=Paenibacillus alvei TaxID=44250 RepID=UPI000289C1BB|nr:crossover junction endodeoxyribonuclease RuvC [Paenibacillus alvei]EJW14424.1 hypothetical protein PAV_13c00430 [Paenibacillus alvei DSM 29]MCY9544833.1 crossover junction endodeoxyribonuclease RuvC [Paenibacillus alvei]MCY9708746.1 crossover junction endodeoxyribonuclease RuvC [Paenibacillus alvei]MCY9737294.1 crossover junction endodeoxyribonuclease RuvC [Paenibacillus alvei]MCY9758140.1 crossover junction endodeoxyribonuclease RuvC [Paenibacillus alvei]
MRIVGIDPSTKTGICIMDQFGNLIDAFEVTGEGKDPKRMSDIIGTTSETLEDGDLVGIEGFGFSSQSGFILGGIGWGIRMEMYLRGIKYMEIAPSQLKKFATGKGNAKKDELAVHIFKHWGFEHHSDNVRDAYVLAQVMRAIRMGSATTKYQREVIDAILAPKPEKKKKRA